MRNVLNIIIILSVCLSCVCNEGAEEREGGEVYYYNVKLSSLFPSPSSSCVPSPKASNTKSSMHVVHRYGPCSSLARASPDYADILSRDQARVNSIHSKLSKKSIDRVKQSPSTKLPAKVEGTLGIGNYQVTLGIGTPKQELLLFFDTGSDLTWIQCHSQKKPIFNPSSSSSYSNVSCTSPQCGSVSSPGVRFGCSASTSNCRYRIDYLDTSFTIGNLAKEKFTLTKSDVFDGVTFGCGDFQKGFEGYAGLLGLGRSSLSFPSQTATKYNKTFSYCLPSSASYTGYLTFGSSGISRSVKYTPISALTQGTSFYGLDIVGITVGGQKLAIPLTVFSTPGAIIDSGTVISRLPPKAYAALRTAFKKQMSNYKIASEFLLFDTCYDFTGINTDTMRIPKISFSFSGGAVVDLDSGAILVQISQSQNCLAFVGNDDDENTAIFGNFQQRTLQVVYDGPGNRVGFAPNGCS